MEERNGVGRSVFALVEEEVWWDLISETRVSMEEGGEELVIVR